MGSWTAVGHTFVLSLCRSGHLCSICSAVWSSRPQLQIGDGASFIFLNMWALSWLWPVRSLMTCEMLKQHSHLLHACITVKKKKPFVLSSCTYSRCSCTWPTKQCMLGMARIPCKSPRNTSIASPTRSMMSGGEFSQVGGIPM